MILGPNKVCEDDGVEPSKCRHLTMAWTALRSFSRYPKMCKSWTMHHAPARTFGAIALVIAGLFVMACRQAMAADGPPGITRPVVLPPFDAAAPSCHSPSGLQRVLAFAQDNQRKFMQGVSYSKDGTLGVQETAKSKVTVSPSSSPIMSIIIGHAQHVAERVVLLAAGRSC